MTSLYEKLGGSETIGKVVDKFYDKVMADDTVNHFFANTDMEKQRRHQTDFISYALGGREYSGRSMAAVHRGLNLQPAHFDAIVRHLSESLREFGVSDNDIGQIIEKIGTLRDDILYK